jgi:hypothetical protein
MGTVFIFRRAVRVPVFQADLSLQGLVQLICLRVTFALEFKNMDQMTPI